MNDDDSDTRHEIASDMARDWLGISAADMVAFQSIREALKTIATGAIDSGFGFNCADFWPTINGVEYFVTIRRSNKQIGKKMQ